MKNDNRDVIFSEWRKVSEVSMGIDQETFRNLCEKTFAGNSNGSQGPLEFLNQAFVSFDADKDGYLNRTEFLRFWTSWMEPVLFPRSVLLVIDVQNDFITGSLALKNAPAKQEGAEVIPIANRLIALDQFLDVIYTQDWHPSDHCSFIKNVSKHDLDHTTEITATNAKVFDTIILAGSPPVKQQLFPLHAVQNSDGAELHKDLKVHSNSKILKKGMHSKTDCMSAFMDYRNVSTELDDLLTARNITDVFLCGLALDYCVGWTALDALDLGYRTWIVEDACRGCFEEGIEDTKSRITKKGGMFITSEEVKNILDGSSRLAERAKAGLAASALHRHQNKDA